MTRYRIKILLLTVGVVLGFGSAIARHHYGHGHHSDYRHHGHHACWGEHGFWGEPQGAEGGVESKKPNDAARPTDR